jgi:hypothetical protein
MIGILGPQNDVLFGPLYSGIEIVPETGSVKYNLLGPGFQAFTDGLFGNLEEQDTPSTEYLEEIDINIKMTGTSRKETLLNFINEFQSIKFNITYDVEPVNPIAVICNNDVETEIVISNNSFIIPVDTLNNGFCSMYVYDRTTKTQSQNICFTVYKVGLC